MGHVGNEFLTLVFALLQRGGHVVEGQSQLLHFLAGILVDFHPGIQLAVAEGGGGVGKLLQGLTFPPGKGSNAQDGHQHHKDGGGGENIADFVQNHPGSRGGGGDHDNAQVLLPADNGGGDHIPLLGVEVADGAGGTVAVVFVDLVQILLIQLPAVVVAAGEIAGAQDDIALIVADDHIRLGDLGDDVQVEHQLPACQIVVHSIGAGQVCHHLGILAKLGYGGILQKAVYLILEGRAQNGQCQQKGGCHHGKTAAEGTFHPSGTSFLIS